MYLLFNEFDRLLKKIKRNRKNKCVIMKKFVRIFATAQNNADEIFLDKNDVGGSPSMMVSKVINDCSIYFQLNFAF